MKITLKTKMILAFMFLVAITIMMICTIIGINMTRNSLEVYKQNSNQQMFQINETINLFIENIKKDVDMLSRNSMVLKTDNSITSYKNTTRKTPMTPLKNGGLEAELFKYFRLVTTSHPAYRSISFGTRYGGYLQYPRSARKPGYNPPERGWYKLALKHQGQTTMSEAYIASDGSVYISLVKTVTTESGEILGVVSVDIQFDELYSMVSKIKIGKTGYLILADGNNTILIHSRCKEMDFKKMEESKIPFYKKIADIDSGHLLESLNDKRCDANVYTSPHLGWKLIGVIDHDEIMAHTRSMIWTMVGIGAILFAVSVLMAFLFANSIVKPINRVIYGLKDIAQGEGDLTMRLELTGKDEIAELANWFNIFMEKIHAIIKDVASNATVVDTASARLLTISREMSSAAELTSSKAGVVSKAVEGTGENITSTAAAMEQASTNISMVATATEEMTSTINEIGQNSEKARQISEKAVANARKASKNMGQLGSAVRDIGNVTETITDISEQTNLLALNATIEAARAGEAGKGFAVVAGEIKELSRLTAEATNQIRQKITGVQTVSDEAMSEIENVSRVINDVNEITLTIATAIEEQAAATTEIASNVSQASQGLSSVNENMAQVSAATGEVSSDIADVDASASEISQSSGQVSASAESLSLLGRELSELVCKFRI